MEYSNFEIGDLVEFSKTYYLPNGEKLIGNIVEKQLSRNRYGETYWSYYIKVLDRKNLCERTAAQLIKL